MRSYTSSIARIENNFIFNAQYQLTAREQKVLLFLISNINPLSKDFGIQVVPIKHIEAIVMSKRSGSFYDEMLNFSSRISKKQIVFESNVSVRKRKMKGFINWFQSIIPVHNEAGEICLKFKFSEDLKPFLLELKEYAQIDYLETIPLRSGFSIRMYQIFKAHRDKMAKYQQRSKLKYELEELKLLLGVSNKYADWRKFKRDVVSVIEREINAVTSLGVEVNLHRKGRKITGVEFEIWNKMKNRNNKKTKTALIASDSLTFAQTKAFELLVSYKVQSDIAIQILSKIGGSEIKGFEDWYVEEVLNIFEAKTSQEGANAKAGALVNWILKKKIFEQGDHFATIMERIQARKKSLQKTRPDAWANRIEAKTMTAEDFKLKFG